ncbi:hypothetical protein PBV52_50810 [Streptomyces sp. T12]|nr:hypothetical protein [Streptomyces sp. T12]WDF44485.1 hypothetical protein PBV52_50810 [Streptomyces sp. T12]
MIYLQPRPLVLAWAVSSSLNQVDVSFKTNIWPSNDPAQYGRIEGV